MAYYRNSRNISSVGALDIEKEIKMQFGRDRKNGYLLDTEVENIFISEHMVTAPGDYVKVYLYALMCAETGQSVSEERLAKLLLTEPVYIEKALLYWQERGVIKRIRNGAEDKIEFVSLRDKLFGSTGKDTPMQDVDMNSGAAAGMNSGISQFRGRLYDKQLSDMCKAVEKIIERPLGGKEPLEIFSWIDEFGASPEVIVTAYSYCKKEYKKDAAAYVGKVVKNWMLKGLDDAAKIDEYLGEIERNRFLYKRVFKALGFMRNPTEEEKKIMSRWFSDMNYSIDKVLEACSKTSGISNPNLNYVNKILTDWYKEKNGVLPNEEGRIPLGYVLKYYDYIRNEAEDAARKRKQEIYDRLPEIKELDENIKRAGMETGRLMISGRADRKEAALAVKKSVDKMLADRAAILAENSYPINYTEVKYMCSLCGDTGTTENGERCSCFEQRMEEAKTWRISEKIQAK